MRWIRGRRRLGGWLALCVLSLQLALSFGHIHAEDFAPAKAGAVTTAHSGGGAGTPNNGDHDDCPICAVMHLAGTLLVPVPPAIALPAGQLIARLEIPERHDAPRALTHSFQARGPPQA